MDEEFRDIQGWPGYRIGSLGTVMSCRHVNGKGPLSSEWHALTQYPNADGYMQIRLYNNGSRGMRRVHLLVIAAFVGPPLPGQECRHLDGNRTNNNANNLAWGTHSENMADTIRHKTSTPGEKSAMAKIKERDVIEMIRLKRLGTRHSDIAKQFGISMTNVSYIVNRRSWKHVTVPECDACDMTTELI